MNQAQLEQQARKERELVFQNLYKKLNTSQKKAVDTIDGPVMVIAGPGTGKTTLLTLRIANIVLKTDTSPDSILALTFTDSGVKAMRKKLVGIMGSEAYRVGIYTFHSFAHELIRRYPEYMKRGINVEPIDEIAQIEIMERIILRVDDPFTKLKPHGDKLYYVRPVLDAIKKLKQEYVSPDDLEVILKHNEEQFADLPDLYHEKGKYKGEMKGEYRKLEEAYKKNRELLRAYRAYESVLHEQGLLDFNDLLIEVVDALRDNEDFRLIVQEQFQYVLADEHQDANGVQNTLLEHISSFHESPNLFVVGDEKQAIYRFQGASVENFLHITKRYPETTVIELEENYRSHQTVLDVAHGLIEHSTLNEDHAPKRVRLVAAGKQGKNSASEKPVSLFECATMDDQYEHIVQHIQKLQASQVPLHEIAVLFRDNKSAFPIAHALRNAGIAHQIVSDKNVLADPVVAVFISMLRVLVNPLDSVHLGPILLAQTDIDPIDVFRVLTHAQCKRLSIIDVLTSEEECSAAQVKKFEPLLSMGERIARWVKLVAQTDLVGVIERLLNESGHLERVLAQDGKTRSSFEELEMIEIFFAEAKRAEARGVKTVAQFLEHIDRLEQHELLLKSHAHGFAEHKVVLMTAHRSKGLEFDHVIISQVNDGVWGNKRKNQLFKLAVLERSPHSDDDERRLLYVALTRARHSVSVYYSLRNDVGEEEMPSLFVAELPSDIVQAQSVSHSAKPLNERVRTVGVQDARFGKENMEYIRQIFAESALSVTALNNYLDCPWNYFFTNLVRLPQGETDSQLYGTAMHEALRLFFAEVQQSGLPKKPEKMIGDLCAGVVHKMPIDERRQNDIIKRGQAALSAYVKTGATSGQWLPDFELEYAVRGVHIPYKANNESLNVALTGKLDKIEYVNGPGTEIVRVIDYKTGKPRSRNEIEGLTKNSDGGYKRQLVFYKLLLSLKKPPLRMELARIDFIEPDEKGICKSEAFEVSGDEVAKLIATIEEMASDMHTGAFAQKGCKKKECRFCTLSSLIRLN